MTHFRINALDQSPISVGQSPTEAIKETSALAVFCEAQGYHRFWVAEHHNTSAFAGAAPEILMAHLAAVTSDIKIGSGGIMISHYSPLKIAEQFRMLATLAPGRIDLGIGRAPGGDARTSAALQAGPKAWPPEVFPQQVEMLRQLLEDAAGLSGAEGGWPDDHPYQTIHAQPTGSAAPQIWVLGSGGDSAIYAAQFGLPYVYAHFIGGDDGLNAIEMYKQHFKPSRDCQRPLVGFALSALAAETQADADYYTAPRNLWAVRFLQGQGGIFPSLEQAANYTYDAREKLILDQVRARSLSGTPATIVDGLIDLKTAHDVDEFFIVTITPDATARQASYGLIAEGLRGRNLIGNPALRHSAQKAKLPTVNRASST